MTRLAAVFLSISLLYVGGCAAMAAATAETIVYNLLGIEDDDEDDFERWRREERKLQVERKWIQHWRDNPEDIPAMTEAFKDDYR